MSPTELHSRLTAVANISEERTVSELRRIVVELKASLRRETEHLRTIFRFFEEWPNLYVGDPGPLVHFAETFDPESYEAELLGSLARHPTSHTLWMLNRSINGATNASELKRLSDALKAAENHPLADRQTQEEARHVMERLTTR